MEVCYLRANMSGLQKDFAMTRQYPTAWTAKSVCGERSWGSHRHPEEQMRRCALTAGSQPATQVSMIRKVTRAARTF